VDLRDVVVDVSESEPSARARIPKAIAITAKSAVRPIATTIHCRQLPSSCRGSVSPSAAA
jgi:hypothetical protein